MIPVKRCYLCLGLFAAGLLLLLGSALLARYALLEAPAPLFLSLIHISPCVFVIFC